MRRHIVHTLLAMTALLAGVARAQTTYGPDPRVTTGTLENGLSYLLMPLEQGEGDAARGAAVRLIVEAGLIHEDQNQPGTADVAAEAARIRTGAGATATVGDDRAVISLNLDDAGTLAARLSQLAGVASGQAVPGDQMAAAKAAAAERLSRIPAEQRVHTLALRRLNPASRAVRRPAAGMTDAIRALGADKVQEFASRWYVPSNMMLIVTAPGTAESLTTMVRGAFASLPRAPKPTSPQPAAGSWTPPASPVVLEDPDLREAVVALTAARTSRGGTSIRDFRSSMVQRVGLHVLQSLVQTRLTKGKVPFTTVATDRLTTPDGLAWTAFHVTGDPAKWNDVVTAAVTEANRIRIHGLDRTDVSDALVAMVTDLEAKARAEETANASALADMLVETRGGPSAQQQLSLMLDLLRSISPDDVEWDFNKSFDPSSTAVVLALPARPGVPSESEVGAAVRAAWLSQPDPASELVRPWTLLPVLPAPGEVVEMSQDAESGVWSGWLSNGVRFHVRTMAGRTPGAVDIAMTLAGSELLEDENTRGMSAALGRGWDYPSTASIPESQLNSIFQATNARLSIAATGDHFRFSVSTDRMNFNAYMQRLHAILAGATPSEQAVDYSKEGMIATAQGVGRDINATFMDLMSNTMYVDDAVRSRPITEAQARAITFDRVREWGAKMAAQPIEIAIVGDITPEDAMEALRFYLGSLPARARIGPETFASLRSQVLRPTPHTGLTRVTGPAGGLALALRGFYICGPEDKADALALDVASTILNARLVSEAPRMGLPGGGQVALNFLPDYPGTSFMFYVAQGDLDESGVAHVNKMITEMFTRFATDGPTADELAAATGDVATRLEQSLDYTTGWWDHLSLETYRGRDPAMFTGAPLLVRGFSAETVRDTFAKYFKRPNNVIELAVLPAPQDELLRFIDQPPPMPTSAGEEPDAVQEAQPAGPPSGDVPPGR